nr:MAG TPA: hypothetical protein [Caudoviricetes sp.]
MCMRGKDLQLGFRADPFLRAKHIKYSSKDAFQEKNLAIDSLQRFLRGN